MRKNDLRIIVGEDTQRDTDTLERLVDTYSLSGIKDMLQEICYAKARHLRDNWQDEVAAKMWEDDAE